MIGLKRAAAWLWKTRGADPTKAVVEVVGADPATLRPSTRPEMTLDRWTSFLTVRVVRQRKSAIRRTVLPSGALPRDGDVIRFEPRFPLEPGMRYRAEFDPFDFTRWYEH